MIDTVTIANRLMAHGDREVGKGSCARRVMLTAGAADAGCATPVRRQPHPSPKVPPYKSGSRFGRTIGGSMSCAEFETTDDVCARHALIHPPRGLLDTELAS
jgi:hypothetical protein